MNINAPVFKPNKGGKNSFSTPINRKPFNANTDKENFAKDVGTKKKHEVEGNQFAVKTYNDRNSTHMNPFRLKAGNGGAGDAGFAPIYDDKHFTAKVRRPGDAGSAPNYDDKHFTVKPLHNANTANNPFRGKTSKGEAGPILLDNIKENKVGGEDFTTGAKCMKNAVKSNANPFNAKIGGVNYEADLHPHGAASQKGKYLAAEFSAKPHNNTNYSMGSRNAIQAPSLKSFGGAGQKHNGYNEMPRQAMVKPKFEEPKSENLHPLQNYWTLWHLDSSETNKTWEALLNEITTIGTVEDFWNVYNNIKPPSALPIGSDYSFFKRGIRPMWEDPANIGGGRWVITLNKPASTTLDDLWLNVLLCIIGEVFDNAQEVCGAVVSIRFKCNKIAIWTTNGKNQNAVYEIGTKLRNGLQLGDQNLQYQLHKDTMLKMSSNVPPVYIL